MFFKKKRDETILVVDDEEGVRRLLVNLLTRDGYAVTAVASGAEALEAVAQAPPHLVLLDIRMPEMDGFEVYRLLRAQGYTAPILFLSGLNEDTTVGQGLRLGADYYLTKPFVPRYLLRIVESAIQGRLQLDIEGSESIGSDPG
jgi:two-component system, OmpR family, response regulator